MKIINKTTFHVYAACFVATSRFGPVRMVMSGDSEDIPGPILCKTPAGIKYMDIEGTFTIVENGDTDNPEAGILLVNLRRPRSLIWQCRENVCEGVRVWHYMD